jgi:hypothetical protein
MKRPVNKSAKSKEKERSNPDVNSKAQAANAEFSNQRPEAIRQQKLSAMVQDSTRMTQLKTVQEMADRSSAVKGSRIQQRSISQSIIQGRFYGQNLDQAQQDWNALLGHLDNLHNTHTLPNKADIDNFITDSEVSWYGDGEHEASIVQFNAVVTLKGKIKTGLEQLKLPIGDSAGLGWNDIVNYLTNDISAKGFITVQSHQGRLGGGHGNGTFWTASDGTTGTVPANIHGANDGALGGARGAVRTVIVAHNAAVNAAKTAVDNL